MDTLACMTRSRTGHDRGRSSPDSGAAPGIASDDLLDPAASLPQELVPRTWNLLAARFPGQPLTLEAARMAPAS